MDHHCKLETESIVVEPEWMVASLQVDKDYRGYLLYQSTGGAFDEELTGNVVLAEKSSFPVQSSFKQAIR